MLIKSAGRADHIPNVTKQDHSQLLCTLKSMTVEKEIQACIDNTRANKQGAEGLSYHLIDQSHGLSCVSKADEVSISSPYLPHLYDTHHQTPIFRLRRIHLAHASMFTPTTASIAERMAAWSIAVDCKSPLIRITMLIRGQRHPPASEHGEQKGRVTEGRWFLTFSIGRAWPSRLKQSWKSTGSLNGFPFGREQLGSK